jgi:type II secretory pathway pseudopilin PulG
VNTELLIPLLTFGGTLLLVVTGLLNFSVFVRQLRAAREQLETARRQLESARQQPQILLVQRAMAETSDHLKILIEKPYLCPYFYDNKV